MSTDKDANPNPMLTSKLNADQRRAITIPRFGMYGSRFGPGDIEYSPVPYNYSTITNPLIWRVAFKFGASISNGGAIGFEIYGDSILGRGSSGPQSPDIDFTNLNALKLGVSRRHTLLRPTRKKLFLIDLESTNGTFVNAIPVGRGMAQAVHSGDTISLAGLSFEIEIVHTPADYESGLAAQPLHTFTEEAGTPATTLEEDPNLATMPPRPSPFAKPKSKDTDHLPPERISQPEAQKKEEDASS